MANLRLDTIGVISIENGTVELVLEHKYIPALVGWV